MLRRVVMAGRQPQEDAHFSVRPDIVRRNMVGRLIRRATLAAACAAVVPAAVIAQDTAPNSYNQPVEQNGIYIFRVKVVQRNLDCVNYLHRSGATTIGFEGTPLLPRAKGEARVESVRGGISVVAHFKKQTPTKEKKPKYLTYVLWAISPDGRAQN